MFMKKFWRRRRPTPNDPLKRENPAWNDWCEAVLREVRFRPDHPAIRRELMAHLEDGCADLERLGYDWELAERRTLDAMGSAFVVGCAMDQAHHPFWGWIWRASRWLTVLLLVVTVYTAVFDIERGVIVKKTAGQLMWEPPASAVKVELEHYTVWYDPELAVEEAKDGYDAGIRLWIEEDWPWNGPENWWRSWAEKLEFTDDQGQVRQADDFYMRYSPEEWNGYSWNRYLYTVEIRDLERCPEWLEARYPYGGNSWVLRAERGEAE